MSTGKNQKSDNFSDRLDLLMGREDLGQTEIAGICGVAQSAVSAWVKGTSLPSLPAFHRLAERFGVSMEWLLTGQDRDGGAPALVHEGFNAGAVAEAFQQIESIREDLRKLERTLHRIRQPGK